jgi:hypothetical protein
VDLNSGALVAVTLQGADVGDATSLVETAIAAAEHVEAAHAQSATPAELAEIVADKGYQAVGAPSTESFAIARHSSALCARMSDGP